VGISAENGIFALSGQILSAFSSGDILLWSPENPQGNLTKKKFGVVSLRVHDLEWEQIRNPLPMTSAHGLALCDHLNQIDIHSTDSKVQSVLPAGARVKSLLFVSDDLTLVVYSVSGKPVTYDIRVGLLEHKGAGEYSLLDDDLATDAGNFCGVQTGQGNHFFVFADEPAGSSDSSAVFVYGVRAGERARRVN
jgi:hypothetical protein